MSNGLQTGNHAMALGILLGVASISALSAGAADKKSVNLAGPSLTVASETADAPAQKAPDAAAPRPSMGPDFDKIQANLSRVQMAMKEVSNSLTNYNSSAESKQKAVEELAAELDATAASFGDNGEIGQGINTALENTDQNMARIKPFAENDALDPKLVEAYRNALKDLATGQGDLKQNKVKLAAERGTLLKHTQILRDHKDFYANMVAIGQLGEANKAIAAMTEQISTLNASLDVVTSVFAPTPPPKQ